MNGSPPADGPVDNRLDERLVERCEDLPDSPAPGDYVVVDTMYFSTTVVELLANGAERVHVTDERGREFAYRAAHPRTLVGGGCTDDYEPAAGYDFFNSPSYVQRLDVAGRPVSMTSSNGGRAVADLRARADGTDAGTATASHAGTGADVEVFVGSTTNAGALAAYLRPRDRPVHLVSAGSGGDVAVEDHLGAVLVSRALDGVPVAEAELELYRRQLRVAKGADYVEKHEVRRRDVLEYATAVDSRRVVPKLVGDSLVDVGPDGGSTAAARASD